MASSKRAAPSVRWAPPRVSSPTRLMAASSWSSPGGGGALKRGETATGCSHALALLDQPLAGPDIHGWSLSPGTGCGAGTTNERPALPTFSWRDGTSCAWCIFFFSFSLFRRRGPKVQGSTMARFPGVLMCCWALCGISRLAAGRFGVCGVPTGLARLPCFVECCALHGAGGSTSPSRAACMEHLASCLSQEPSVNGLKNAARRIGKPAGAHVGRLGRSVLGQPSYSSTAPSMGCYPGHPLDCMLSRTCSKAARDSSAERARPGVAASTRGHQTSPSQRTASCTPGPRADGPGSGRSGLRCTSPPDGRDWSMCNATRGSKKKKVVSSCDKGRAGPSCDDC